MALFDDANVTLDALYDFADNVTQTAVVVQRVVVDRCGNGSVNGQESLYLYRYVMNVIVMAPVVSLGIVANVVAFVVLCRQKQRLTTTVLLQGLAVADTLILLTNLFRCVYISYSLGCKGNVHATYVTAYEHVWPYTYMFMYFIRLVDTWLTILLTIDRYIAVCKPLQAQRICTLVRTYRNMSIVVVVSFFLSLSRLFEYSRMRPTSLVQSNVVYLFAYRIAAFSVFMYLVPMTLLTALNTKLLCELRRANRFRRLARQTSGSDHSVPATKKSVTVIVVTVVLVCIVCNATAFTSHLLWTLHVVGHLRLAGARRYAASISNLLVSVNSAVNFFIYCLCSRNFRTELVGFFRCRLGRRARAWKSHSSTGSLPADTLMVQLSVCSGCGSRDSTLTARSFCQTCSRRHANSSVHANRL